MMVSGTICRGGDDGDAWQHAQDGCTALIYATWNGHLDCTRLLVDAGANKDAKTNVRDDRCIWHMHCEYVFRLALLRLC